MCLAGRCQTERVDLLQAEDGVVVHLGAAGRGLLGGRHHQLNLVRLTSGQAVLGPHDLGRLERRRVQVDGADRRAVDLDLSNAAVRAERRDDRQADAGGTARVVCESIIPEVLELKLDDSEPRPLPQ